MKEHAGIRGWRTPTIQYHTSTIPEKGEMTDEKESEREIVDANENNSRRDFLQGEIVRNFSRVK